MIWCLGCLTSAGVWSALAGELIAHYCMYLCVCVCVCVDVVMASSLYVVPAVGLIRFAVPVRNGNWFECGVTLK